MHGLKKIFNHQVFHSIVHNHIFPLGVSFGVTNWRQWAEEAARKFS